MRAADVLLDRIQERREGKDVFLVGIDGRCGSGKTTLCREIRKRTGWSVIPMDDFFLRASQRTSERLSLPGGNVDHERFRSEVLEPLKRGGDIFYRPYFCREKRLLDPCFVPRTPVILVEGSYCLHPDLWDGYGLRVFVDVLPEEQRRRLLLRNPEKFEDFSSLWIPLEEKYFSAFDLKNRCDLVLKVP